MQSLRVLFLVRRVGPYHDARFEAAGRRLGLTVVETRPGSQEYPWTTSASAKNYQLAAFRPAKVPEAGLRGAELSAEIDQILRAWQPHAVATAGWADPEYHALLRRCHTLGIPAVVMTDSTLEDEPRRWWKEMIKTSVLRGYSSAVVAGSRSRDYLQQLGFPVRAVFQPWDVVDNRYFAEGSDRQRRATGVAVESPAAETRRFLCVARFIPKKNLDRLLAAYAAYVRVMGDQAWNLVLSGSGPLEADLRTRVGAAHLTERVEFSGFQQYPALPGCYAHADALILPSWSDQWGLVVNEAMAAGLPVIVSRRCGCAPDLVREGENGFVFDPFDAGELQDCLLRVSRLTSEKRRAMGRCSRELIAAYSPESFAAGLNAAVICATERRLPRTPPLTRVLTRLLAARNGAS